MPGLIIRAIPEGLHKRLKEQAAAHHRSMNKEIIALLEQALNMDQNIRDAPPPYRGKQPLTESFINDAKRRGRK